MVSRLALGLVAGASLAAAGPCDIYASGGTPCVAAHSTTRALFNSFTGGLYQVKRASDSKTLDIVPLNAGGVANSAAQDSFCSGTTCLISIIYDQTSKKNHLTQAPPGGFQGPAPGGYDNLASATAAPVMLNGKRVYGVFVAPGTGYRNNKAVGTAIGDQPEGMYAVLDGTHYNGGCCFDYGNAETSGRDTGNGHMETIYFGNCKVWGTGAGNGPWIMADLENGLFSGVNVKNNPGDPTITDRFITAAVKGKPGTYAIRGANAVSANALSTFYNGKYPNANGYSPMHKEGAIILGIGGDNSHGAQGTFYEGVMTTGFPSDATENAVQANVQAQRYATASMLSGPEFTEGESVTFRATSPGRTDQFIAHSGEALNTQIVTSSSSPQLKDQATWIVRAGLGRPGCFSFESKDTPNNFIRHTSIESNWTLQVALDDGSKDFGESATFCPQEGLNGQGNSLRSWNHPTRFIRPYEDSVHVASNDNQHDHDTPASFNDDVSFVAGTGFA